MPILTAKPVLPHYIPGQGPKLGVDASNMRLSSVVTLRVKIVFYVVSSSRGHGVNTFSGHLLKMRASSKFRRCPQTEKMPACEQCIFVHVRLPIYKERFWRERALWNVAADDLHKAIARWLAFTGRNIVWKIRLYITDKALTITWWLSDERQATATADCSKGEIKQYRTQKKYRNTEISKIVKLTIYIFS